MIGDRIRELRKSKGWSQNKLAEMIGNDGNTISRWELNKVGIGGDYLLKLAEVLDTSTDYLLGITDNLSFVPETSSEPIKEPQIKTEDKGVLIYEANGQKIQVPATPEYAAQFWARVDNMIGKGGE